MRLLIPLGWVGFLMGSLGRRSIPFYFYYFNSLGIQIYSSHLFSNILKCKISDEKSIAQSSFVGILAMNLYPSSNDNETMARMKKFRPFSILKDSFILFPTFYFHLESKSVAHLIWLRQSSDFYLSLTLHYFDYSTNSKHARLCFF